MLFWQILIDGFAISALYALGATGFTLIFGVSGVLNLSHARADRTLKIWDLARGTDSAALASHGGAVRAVAVFPEGRAVSGSSDRSLKIWDLARGTELATLTG